MARPPRNCDGLGHAAAEANHLVPGTTLLSFEDLPNSQSFNDLSFFTGTAAGSVPQPATWPMMVIGIGATGGAVRARRCTVRCRTA